MGVRIDIKRYKSEELIEKLKEWGADNDELAVSVLKECGMFIGDEYVLLNNEYHSEYNPYYTVGKLFDLAFGKTDSFRVFLNNGKSGISSVDGDDIADRLGIL